MVKLCASSFTSCHQACTAPFFSPWIHNSSGLCPALHRLPASPSQVLESLKLKFRRYSPLHELKSAAWQILWSSLEFHKEVKRLTQCFVPLLCPGVQVLAEEHAPVLVHRQQRYPSAERRADSAHACDEQVWCVWRNPHGMGLGYALKCQAALSYCIYDTICAFQAR